jgi:hypothetical protein
MGVLVYSFGVVHYVVTLACALLMLFAVGDAAVRPAAYYPAAGKRTKRFWVGILVGGILLSFVSSIFGIAGLVAAIVYLVDVRPRLRELRNRSRTPSGPYGPW